MKEKYIRKVKKALPRKFRAEILRDLEEIFQSAAEHDETDEQVIERLGDPADFARESALQLGIDLEKRKMKRSLILTIIFTAIAIIAIIIHLIVRETIQEAVSIGIIGGADGPTSIIVAGPGFNLSTVSLAVAVIAAIVTAILLVKRYLRKKK